MQDNLIPAFLKKLTELEKIARDDKNDRSQIIAKIVKLQQWLVGDRSLREHYCAFSFMQFLYNSYGDQFQSFEGFRSWLACKNGMAKINITEAEVKFDIKQMESLMIEIADCIKDGDNSLTGSPVIQFVTEAIYKFVKSRCKVIYKKYLVDSMSFGSCSQKKFHEFFTKLQDFAENTWKIKFSEWHSEWEKNEHLIQ